MILAACYFCNVVIELNTIKVQYLIPPSPWMRERVVMSASVSVPKWAVSAASV